VPNQKYHPQRTCLGCCARDGQSKLVRIVAENQGQLKIDDQGKGRGGYLHPVETCWQLFMRRKSSYRAFHIEIGKGAKECLIQALKGRHWE
jgi:predicted RNA-binding protein YlxR (DUF448 family)